MTEATKSSPRLSNGELSVRLAGWGARIRTWEWWNQNPLPYHLATPHRESARTILMGARRGNYGGGVFFQPPFDTAKAAFAAGTSFGAFPLMAATLAPAPGPTIMEGKDDGQHDEYHQLHQ